MNYIMTNGLVSGELNLILKNNRKDVLFMMTVNNCVTMIERSKLIAAEIDLKFKTLTPEERAHEELISLLERSKYLNEQYAMFIGGMVVNDGDARITSM